MATDPSIILSGIDYPTQLAKVQSNQGNALKLQLDRMAVQQQKVELQKQNALRAILADAFNHGTEAHGPSDDWEKGSQFKLPPELLNKIARIDPKTAMDLSKGEVEADEKRAQMAHLNSETHINNLKNVVGEAGTALNVYDQHMAAGDGEEASRAAAQKVWDKSYKGFQNGELPAELLTHVPTKFDPMEFRARSLTVQQTIAAHQKEKGQELQEEGMGIRKANLGIQEKKLGLAEEKADREASGALTEDAIDMAADQILAGDRSALTNMGRGAQGGVNLAAIRNRVAEKGKAQGLSGHDLANIDAEFKGQVSGEQFLGRRGAQLSQAGAALDKLIDQSKEIYKELPRGDFLPYNRLRQKVSTETSSPEQAAAFAADTAVINQWAKAINPTGVLTVEATRKGSEMLSNVTSHAAHDRVLDQMRKEIGAERESVPTARSDVRRDKSETEHPPLTMLHDGQITTFKNGQRWTLKGGRAVKLGE